MIQSYTGQFVAVSCDAVGTNVPKDKFCNYPKYHKNPENSDTPPKKMVIILKFERYRFFTE